MRILLALLLVVLASGLTQAGSISIEVVPALAPNVYGSPSFTAWQSNAIYALEHGLDSYGNLGSPERYQAGSNYNSAQVVVTGFPSWMGQAGPTGAYAAELGNRMHLGLRIDGGGAQFSISELGFSASSTDPFNALAFAYPDGYNYGPGYVGVLAGLDGQLWTADDTYITGGASTQLVDGLVARGSGNSFAAYCPGCSLADQQAALDAAAAYPGAQYLFMGAYTLTDASGQTLASGSATFTIDSVPEPGTLALVGSALVGLGLFRRRRAG